MTWLAVMVSFPLLVSGVAKAQQGSPAPTAEPKDTPSPRSSSSSPSGVDGRSELGFRLDCPYDFNIDKGATQRCFTLSGLSFTHWEELDPEVTAWIRLDPFAAPNSSKTHLPDRGGLPRIQDTDMVLIDDYAVVWHPRPALEVALEEYGGAARIPSVSGLSLASPFQDAGWDQAALSVNYNLGAFEGMRVKFAAGNGEGEIVRNMDPQQYFGFEVSASVIKGINAMIGVSLDGNDVGSLAYSREKERWAACGVQNPPNSKQGHSTQRLAVGLEMDGTMPGATGLKVGLGFQRSIQADLDKEEKSRLDAAELAKCSPQVDVDSFFVEDASGEAVNTVQRRVIGLNAQYEVFAGYFVAFDYETRLIDTGSVELFQVCEGFEGTTCPDKLRGETMNKLEQNSLTFGGGMRLSERLMMTLEYNTTSYDKNYVNAFYASRDGKASDTREIFNARLAYNWK